MKKTKRLLSFLTALTITASAFAGMVIPANAAPTYLYQETFETHDIGDIIKAAKTEVQPVTLTGETGSVTFSVGSRSGGMDYYHYAAVAEDDGNKYIDITQSNYSTSNRGIAMTFSSDISASAGKVLVYEFDAKFDAGAAMTITDIANIKSDVASIKAGEWSKVKVILDSAAKKYYIVNSNISTGVQVGVAEGATNATALKSITFHEGGPKTGVHSYFDNMAVYEADNDIANLTLTVNDNSDTPAPVAGADVVITGAGTYKTDEQGQISINVPQGTYNYSITKDGYEATAEQKDALTGSITVGESGASETLTLLKQVYTPVPDDVTLSGGQKVMTAPHTAETTTSAEYTVAVLDQNDVPITDGDLVWTVVPTGSETADANVTIDDGVITVAKGFTAGDTHVKSFTVTATVTKNGESKSATATIDISDYLFYEPGIGGSSYGSTHTAMLNTNGTNEGTDSFIATPNERGRTDSITLPDPIVFKNGTAQLLSFKTTVQNKTAFTYKREVAIMDGATPIIAFGYINLDIGDSATADWNANTSSFATTWGSISALNAWTDVSILFKTNANGVTKMVYTVAGKEYEAETTATGVSAINLTEDLNNVDRYALLKDIVISEVDVTGIGIEGPDEFSSIAGQTVTKDFAVDAMVIGDDETFTWSTDIAGATITADPENSQKATLSVPGTVTAGGKVTVVSSASTEEKPKTATIDVKIEPAQVKSATINGTATMDKSAGTASYTVSDVKDQFGADVTEYFTPEWSVAGGASGAVRFTVASEEAGTAVAIKAEYDGNKLTNVTTENVTLAAGDNTIDVEAPIGAKVMLWDTRAGMKPLTESKTAEAQQAGNASINDEGVLSVEDNADVTITAKFANGDKEFRFQKRVMVNTFSLKQAVAEGDVDVSSIANYGASTYTVTFTGGKTVVKTAEDDKITITAEDIDGVTGDMEIVPNYKFNLSGVEDDNYTSVTGVKKNGYGFTSAATPVEGTGTGIQSKGVDLASNSFEVDIPDGRYDMTFYKADTNRTHIKMNELYTIPEADYTDGDSNNTIPAPGIYTQKDVIVSGGVAKINAYEWGKGVPLMSAVEITKKSELEPRKTHIWIAGDSTVTNYRPTPTGRDDWAMGTRRTGWGQLFEYYLQNSVIVDDYAHSGDYSVGWYNSTFPSVLQKAQAGDYLLIQFGINDRADKNKCPTDVMAEYLGKMVDECRAKGVIPVLITPQICGSQYGSVGEHEQSTGSGNAAWFNVNKTVAEAKDVLLIDLADISGKLWATVGKTWVHQNYMLYNHTTNEQVDAQHMSYQGAKIVAQLVATEIYDQIEEGTTTATGESFAGIPVNAKSDATITYTDAADNTEKTVERQGVTFSLDKTAAAMPTE